MSGSEASTIWIREDLLFPAHLAGVKTILRNIYKCGIMLVLKGMMFLRDHLYSYNSYMDEHNVIRKFASLNLAHSYYYSQRVLIQGGLSPRTRADP